MRDDAAQNPRNIIIYRMPSGDRDENEINLIIFSLLGIVTWEVELFCRLLIAGKAVLKSCTKLSKCVTWTTEQNDIM